MLDESLRRLQMSYVDILYIHDVSSRDDVLDEEYLAGLKAAKESGKARHIGLSTHKNEPEVVLAAAEGGVMDVVLTSLNFKQEHQVELRKAIREAAESGVGIIAMKTMAGGFFDRAKSRPVNCRAALKWVLQNPHVTTTIPGIKTFDQLADNVSVNEDPTLTDQERSDLTIGAGEPGLYCSGCGDCVGSCRNSLPIPDLMRAYMYTYGYGDPGLGKEVIDGLALRPSPCGDCAICSSACVKGFAIRERITDVMRLREVPQEFLA
jgi:predicted aldo/keto reductase-like oxidoreductase